MNEGMVFGMTTLALLEVMKSQFTTAYGVEPRESIGFVLLVGLILLLLFFTLPDLNHCLT